MYCLHFEDLAASLVGGLRMTPVCFEPSQPALVKLEPTHSEQLGNVSCVIRAGKKAQKKTAHSWRQPYTPCVAVFSHRQGIAVYANCAVSLQPGHLSLPGSCLTGWVQALCPHRAEQATCINMGVGVGRLSVPCGEDAIAAVVFRLVRGGQALGGGVGCGGGVGGKEVWSRPMRPLAHNCSNSL